MVYALQFGGSDKEGEEMIEFIDSNAPNSGLRNVVLIYKKMFEKAGLPSYLTTLHFDENLRYDEPVVEYPHIIGSGFTFNLFYDAVFSYPKIQFLYPEKYKNTLKIYNTTLLKPKKSHSFVLIHDLYFDQSPIRAIRLKHRYILNYMKKHGIPFITVSNYTAEKLRKIGLDGVVIHPLPYDLYPPSQKENIVLMVGSQDARKNVEFMNTFTSPSFLDHARYLPVKVGGGVRFGENLFDISNDELDKLYTKAKFLLFPSFDEGFGLPVLEALLHRCIVISNDIPTSREIDMGENIIEFIDVKNPSGVFPDVASFLDRIQDRRRDYDAWFSKYRRMANDDVRKFVEYAEKRGWI